MSAPLRFMHAFTVNAPLERIADFHRDSRALRILTPPPVFVQFHRVDPLGENSIADFSLWLGPIPVRWVARHTEFDPYQGFTDTQISGPFTSWVHRHQFSVISDQLTEVRDEVTAEFGTHPFWGFISRAMWLNLSVLFKYRAFQTRRFCEAA